MIALETWGRGDQTRLAVHQLPHAVLQRLADRDGPGCAECTRVGLTPPTSEPLEVDHRQPISLGGDNHWTNLQILCRYHNRSRGNRAADPRRLPTWLAALARAGDLGAHVAWCQALGRPWAPTSKWLAWRVEVLLRSERGAS